MLFTKISLLRYVGFTGNLLPKFQRSLLSPFSWYLKMLVTDYQWTQVHIQEDLTLCQYHCENLKSHNIINNESNNNNPSTKQNASPTGSSKYSRVSFCDGSFYDDLLLRTLLSWTACSWLAVRHFCNSSVLSVLSALLALFRCACVSSFSILVKFY